MRGSMRVRKNIPWEALSDYIDALGSASRFIDRNLGEDLRYVASLLPQLRHALPTSGACPYCKAAYLVGHFMPERRGTEEIVEHTMTVVKWICVNSDEYRMGYRAVWRCQNCGEMEVR
jgi:hypothetical protein